MQFPQAPRPMTNQEGEQYFENLLAQVRAYAPEEIIAISRSGFSYAGWIAQELNLPLGAYWPERELLVNTKTRLVFVDDNTITGETYLELAKFLEHKNLQWKMAVFFCDWHTPQHIRDQLLMGVHLPYFAQGGYWGRRFSKSHTETFEATPFTRFRDMS